MIAGKYFSYLITFSASKFYLPSGGLKNRNDSLRIIKEGEIVISKECLCNRWNSFFLMFIFLGMQLIKYKLTDLIESSVYPY
jgi:hypothetical protein